jgi:predicted RNA-binding Zn ribbon-like protein
LRGIPSIDYANTLDSQHTLPKYYLMPDGVAFPAWGKETGILPADIRATGRPAKKSMDSVREVRAVLARIFQTPARSQSIRKTDLASFHTLLDTACADGRINSSADGYKPVYGIDDPLDGILNAVIRSAADLPLAGRLEAIKTCPECGWLFYDTSRNQLRRWCDMRTCGNRVKARRHYECVRRQRIASAGGGRKKRLRPR